MVMQAYDFLELSRRYGCRLQMGGSDQWGNIVNGVELGRRIDGAQLFGLTTPLLTTASGAKMGKTAAGAVWLDADGCRPYDYWQFWRNTEDADVGRFLRLFTDLPLDEIARLERLEGAEINEAKKVLASEATRLCHGEAAERPRRRRATCSREPAAVRRPPARLRSTARRWRGCGDRAFHPRRPCRLERRGTRLIRAGGAGSRRRSPTRRCPSTRRMSRPAASSSRPARSATSSSGLSERASGQHRILHDALTKRPSRSRMGEGARWFSGPLSRAEHGRGLG